MTKTLRCRRCEWKSTDDPVDVTDGCTCACHAGGAFRPPCDVEGGCGLTHRQELSPDVQLALHAMESGHPLCILCYRSLTEAERQTCERCIKSTQSTLAGVRVLYVWLPWHLRTIGSSVHSSGHSADGRPLVGGDALALLGPGSQGFDEDGTTSKDKDPVSIAFELHWWERDWRETRNDPFDDVLPRSATKVALDAAGYLERHTRWAANSHPGFDDYARDLDAIHARLQVATGQVRQPTKLNLDCFHCGGPLVKKITKAGLEDDSVTCRSCGLVYSPNEFAMSRAWAYLNANTWTDTEGGEWATSAVLAVRLDRSEHTIKQWRRDGLVDVVTIERVAYYNVEQAEAENATRPKRTRAS